MTRDLTVTRRVGTAPGQWSVVPWSPPRPRCGIYPLRPGADGGHVLHPANISGYLLCVGMESQKVTESCCARLSQVSEVTHQ